MKWSAIAAGAPGLGTVVSDALIKPGVLLAGTIRRFDADGKGQHVARWPADVEFIRPALTPTSLGPPQPVRRLLGT